MAKNKENDLLIKIVSLIMSFGLWIYLTNVENPTKTVRINNVGVRLVNTESLADQSLVLVPGQTLTVNLSITGPASTVYRALPTDFRVEVDMSGYDIMKGINELPVDITLYPQNVDITKSRNLKATVRLDELVEKEVPVISEYTVKTAEGYFAAPSSVTPTTAKIKGPSEYVEKVVKLIIQGTSEGLSKDLDVSVDVVPVDEGGSVVQHVEAEPGEVQFSARVYRTKSVVINPVTTGTMSDGLSLMSLTPVKQSITIAGPEDLLGIITRIDTEKINLRGITASGSFLVPISVPDGIYIVGGESSVEVAAVVEVQGTRDLNVEIKTVNLKEGLLASVTPASISISIRGPQGVLDAIAEGSIFAELDLAGLEAGGHELVPKVRLPEGAVLEKLNPENVSVTISIDQN
ncbi:CdaR family protein [Youngiibacter multivorans]|uniref:YbbR domain-containing protein n=1 Tax=Youngiibacter multivorans TaxID=937251 RepID=A0ABS4G3E7_9CLOT|nr:CdaR family protein [Youngiibacter multivorans]MBP1919061.1 YbbR domain-containing protein [Youngiibacter multivorans]